MKKVIVYASTVFGKMLAFDAKDNNDFVIEAFTFDSAFYNYGWEYYAV